jgi:hypothetical protein
MDHGLRMKDSLQEYYIQTLNIKKIACVVSRFGKPVEGTVHINKITEGALCDAVHTVYQDIPYFEKSHDFTVRELCIILPTKK